MNDDIKNIKYYFPYDYKESNKYSTLYLDFINKVNTVRKNEGVPILTKYVEDLIQYAVPGLEVKYNNGKPSYYINTYLTIATIPQPPEEISEKEKDLFLSMTEERGLNMETM